MSSSLNGRVLHIGKFYPPFRGGMETYLADLIDEQRRQGIYAIGLVHGQPQADDPSWLHRVPVQAQVLYAPVGLGFPFTLRRLIRQFDPDMLHLHMPNNAVFWALLMPMTRKVPWVIHWHSDVVRSSIRRLISVVYALVYEPFERAMLRHAQRIIVSSPTYLAASAPLAPWKDKVEVVPLGLTPQAQRHPCASDVTATEWQPHALRLFSLGRLTYYKGFETLIQAVSGMSNVQLLIAGGGDMESELAALVRACTPAGQPPAIRLLGAVSEAEKHALLTSCDIFCLASRERTEAFGLVVLEAMEHGKPCIVSNLHGSGLPWVVTQAGGGLLAEVDDAPSWQAAIRQLQTNVEQRQQLGAAGQLAFSQRFSIEASAHGVATVYASVLPDVFFKIPSRQRLQVVIAGESKDDHLDLASGLKTLQAAQPYDTLLIGPAAQRAQLEQVADKTGAVCLTLPLDISHWHAVQTGLRYGLLHGYQSVLVLNESDLPSDTAARLIQARQEIDAPIDLLIGTAAHSAAQSIMDRWVQQLIQLSPQAAQSSTRLYEYDAMVIAGSRSATLLDHDNIGALLAMKNARLLMAEAVVRPGTGTSLGPWRTLKSIVALMLFRFSSWSVRRRDPTAPQ